MTHEYDDPITQERLETATGLVVSRCTAAPGTPLQELAEGAVQEVFCTCVTDAEDVAEQRFSEIHTVLIAEVRSRATERLGIRDRVELASEQSFPASDPPGWVWGKDRKG